MSLVTKGEGCEYHTLCWCPSEGTPSRFICLLARLSISRLYPPFTAVAAVGCGGFNNHSVEQMLVSSVGLICTLQWS